MNASQFSNEKNLLLSARAFEVQVVIQPTPAFNVDQQPLFIPVESNMSVGGPKTIGAPHENQDLACPRCRLPFVFAVNALTLLSIGECRSISLVFFGVAAVGLGIGVPLLTVETNTLGYRKCPSEISHCTSTCIYKSCENCTIIPVLTRCFSTSNETIYSETCDKDAIVGCVRNDTLAEVGHVFQRNDSARGAGIAFVVIGSVAALVSLFAAANVEQANKFASQPGLSH